MELDTLKELYTDDANKSSSGTSFSTVLGVVRLTLAGHHPHVITGSVDPATAREFSIALLSAYWYYVARNHRLPSLLLQGSAVDGLCTTAGVLLSIIWYAYQTSTGLPGCNSSLDFCRYSLSSFPSIKWNPVVIQLLKEQDIVALIAQAMTLSSRDPSVISESDVACMAKVQELRRALID